MGDGNIKDSMIIDGLWCAMNDYHMGTTAENIAESFNISKDDQDKFAVKSQNKTEKAQKNNNFKKRLFQLKLKSKKETVEFKEDEFPRHGTTFEKLNSLNLFLKRMVQLLQETHQA